MIVRGIETVACGKDMVRSTKKTTLTNLFGMPEKIWKNDELFFATQIGLYQKYVRTIEAIARDNNVRTAYFLRPIPAWGKPLTDDEKRAAGDLSYGVLYRRIMASMMTLKDRGLAITTWATYWRTSRAQSPLIASISFAATMVRAAATG
jgi:hypothetical protein